MQFPPLHLYTYAYMYIDTYMHFYFYTFLYKYIQSFMYIHNMSKNIVMCAQGKKEKMLKIRNEIESLRFDLAKSSSSDK